MINNALLIIDAVFIITICWLVHFHHSAPISVHEPSGNAVSGIISDSPSEKREFKVPCVELFRLVGVWKCSSAFAVMSPLFLNYRELETPTSPTFGQLLLRLCYWPAVNRGRFPRVRFTHFMHRVCAIFIKNVVSIDHPHLWKCPAVLRPLRGYSASWRLRQHVNVLPHSQSPSETNCSADHMFSP